ncbi:Asnsd1 [Scenedesmus sp. PABB004]|nr:Asnsd1 [Scenedesmus sp. PABB004]
MAATGRLLAALHTACRRGAQSQLAAACAASAQQPLAQAAQPQLQQPQLQQPLPWGAGWGQGRCYARLPEARPSRVVQQHLAAVQAAAAAPAPAHDRRGQPVEKIYRGRWIIPVRFLVRAKVFQLIGGGSVGLLLGSLALGTSASLADVLALTGLAGGMVAASCCLWYYSRRYVGEMSLLLPERRVVRLSVLDFWGNREDNDVPLESIEPPFKGARAGEVSRLGGQLLFPVRVAGDRQYYFHGLADAHVLQPRTFMAILKGEFDPAAPEQARSADAAAETARQAATRLRSPPRRRALPRAHRGADAGVHVMCGILLVASDAAEQEPATDDLEPALRRRGPDALGTHQVTVPCPGAGGALRLRLAASLLQLRGAAAAPPACPLSCASSGGVLAFNGEVFGGLAVPGLLSALRGPWALAYWQAAAGTLWFGRDWLGRRSLLLRRPRQGGGAGLVLCSVAAGEAAAAEAWVEVPPGIYSIAAADLLCLVRGGGDGPGSGAGPGRSDADADGGAGGATANGGIASPADLTRALPGLRHHAWTDPQLQRLAAYERSAGLVPDDAGAQQPSAAAPDAADGEAPPQLLALLRDAVAVRCLTNDRLAEQQQPAAAETRQPVGGGDASTGDAPLAPAAVLILFSGGVDSTLLAALAHAALPPGAPIDLANVCFAGGASPDRVAARVALLELAALAPGRPWRLFEVDSSLAEVDAAAARITALLRPAGTVMDLNIGAALWLAARGEGRAFAPAPRPGGGRGLAPLGARAHRSAARVVLLGHGADEQAGGYGRHRTRFRLGGWRGLADELALDVRRLWLRNLGRDDRLVSDHGREARHPFLDEALMDALLGAPLRALADLRLPPGVGDKRPLRAALAALGLPGAAAREKRAIQFGSRLAQISNARQFGSSRRGASGGQVPLAALPRAACVAAAASAGTGAGAATEQR